MLGDLDEGHAGIVAPSGAVRKPTGQRERRNLPKCGTVNATLPRSAE